jgi:hypothetical protein
MPRPRIPRFINDEGFCVLSTHAVCSLLRVRIRREVDPQQVIHVYKQDEKGAWKWIGQSRHNECVWEFFRRENLLPIAERQFRRLSIDEQDRLRNVLPVIDSVFP